MSDLVEQVRDWVGSTPDDDTIYATLARFTQDPLQAARVLLQRRLADLQSSYATFEVTGDAKWSVSKDQMAAIATQIGDLTGRIGDGPEAPAGLPTLASVPICGPTADR